MQKTLISLLTLTLLLWAGLSLAKDSEVIEEIALDEDVQAQDLEISDPRLLPDNPFYFFKTWGRNVQSFFTFNSVKKAELKLKFANEKLIEAKKLVEKDKKPEMIERGLENYKKEMERIKLMTDKIEEKATESEEVGKFLDKFTQHQLLHYRVLQKLETQVPEESFEKIKEVRETHLEKFGQVMIKLEEKEKLQERLEKNLQEVKGGEFKEFKNLEVLKELEEKVPEEAKEAIRNAQENSLRQLKAVLEVKPLQTFKDYAEQISGEKERHIEILEKLEIELQEVPAIKESIIQSRDRILEKVKEQEEGEEEEEEEKREFRACIELWNPVCGTNGKTYSNECFAKTAEVKIQHKGACRSVKNITPQKVAPQMLQPQQ